PRRQDMGDGHAEKQGGRGYFQYIGGPADQAGTEDDAQQRVADARPAIVQAQQQRKQQQIQQHAEHTEHAPEVQRRVVGDGQQLQPGQGKGRGTAANRTEAGTPPAPSFVGDDLDEVRPAMDQAVVEGGEHAGAVGLALGNVEQQAGNRQRHSGQYRDGKRGGAGQAIACEKQHHQGQQIGRGGGLVGGEKDR